ncbi:hypothetical protein HOP50_06g44430 [Chloropicon primus]|uniref:Uncharacterized protein n=1 Tax=Chloropicon primus TaxID=1764295 RepID=A0A5B8MNL9_9CHLO|nr:hypothetical protein A3770_06p44190 [Chloropicon primus]UPR01122.1 hypothetical protein HOP50_06g44430 [Chloropicon primus]|eukprot:QDZ21901.1 hypothetical protein A3770_06p44190 [Chloropicon primus]
MAKLKSLVALSVLVLATSLVLVEGGDRRQKFREGRRTYTPAPPPRPRTEDLGGGGVQTKGVVPDEAPDLETSASWSTCNVTGKCIKCTREEMIKDPTSCKATRHRRQITCIDPGKEGEGRVTPRETFTMYESCKVDRPLGLGSFMGIMLAILIFSSPMVVIRRRRAR